MTITGEHGQVFTVPEDMEDAARATLFFERFLLEIDEIAREEGLEPEPEGVSEATERLRGQVSHLSPVELYRLALTFAHFNRSFFDPEVGVDSPEYYYYHPDLDADLDGDVDDDDAPFFASSMDPPPDEDFREMFEDQVAEFRELYLTRPDSSEESSDGEEALDGGEIELTDEDLELPGLEPDDEEEE